LPTALFEQYGYFYHFNGFYYHIKTHDSFYMPVFIGFLKLAQEL